MTRAARVTGAAAMAVLAAGLVACAGRPPPDWQLNAKSGLDRAIDAWLVGNARVEAQEFDGVRSEIARTGRPALLARAELVRCAARVASLVIEACAGYEALAADAEAPERAYAKFLSGHATPEDAALLPEQHRALVVAGATPASDLAALEGMADPLSRLVGAAVSLQYGRAGPGVVALAVDTASAQGWRRPLLAWLQVQLSQAEGAGDIAAAERIRRRIGIAQGAPAARPAQTGSAVDASGLG